MNLFVLTFDILGQAATYSRTVQVFSPSENEAKDKVRHHFKKTGEVEFSKVSEVLGKFGTDIFSMPTPENEFRELDKLTSKIPLTPVKLTCSGDTCERTVQDEEAIGYNDFDRMNDALRLAAAIEGEGE